KILKGSLKGRNLVCPAQARPVSVLVRKACFDILGEEIGGKRVLDLFAGAGSLGIEAISAGAKEAVFVDIRHDSIKTIKKALELFKITSKAQVYVKDAFKAVQDFYACKEVFDIVFLDPPYYQGTLRKILQTLEGYDIVIPFGYLVGFCYTKDDFVREIKGFSLIVEKRYGQTVFLIYRKNEKSHLPGNI
ncbi:MAG: 16S rRNA (guanine(966)-N(2))-methyltransferase RsmD, partial [Candidatus Omnitrophica bacterium]|nr:16S rRNA (guanine(966)-N(2))-methyltransferase RsmD [Candidatus Omnitrophota bacterium]